VDSNKENFFKIFLVVVVLTGALILGKLLISIKEKSDEGKGVGEIGEENVVVEKCPVNIEERIVRGNSLNPLIKSGDTIKVLFSYYNCHKIERGDVVAYDYAGDKYPIIKIIKGMPGDKLELRKTDSGWNILINEQILRNSEGKPYLVTGNRYKMLSLYEDDCSEGIPGNTYLILGNLVFGSLDSTRFGLIDESGILAKVEI
jgi:signal peptidase I